MPVVFAQRGMTTLGKSLNVSQLSADPWEKFLRCCQAGFASCSFFFSAPNNSKGIILLNGERHSDPVRGPQPEAPLTLGAGFCRVRTLALLSLPRPHRVPHRIFSIAHKGQGALRPQGDTGHKAAGRLAFQDLPLAHLKAIPGLNPA